jgi:hypothetical protein
MLEAEINNGGFSQYMFNSTSDRGLLAVEGCARSARIPLATVCERFSRCCLDVLRILQGAWISRAAWSRSSKMHGARPVRPWL